MPRNERSSSKSGQCKPKGDSSILLSWDGVPLASRGFSGTGKRSCTPLCMEITMNPSSKQALRAVSAKVLMPLLDNKGLMLAQAPARAIALRSSGRPTREARRRDQRRIPLHLRRSARAHGLDGAHCCRRKIGIHPARRFWALEHYRAIDIESECIALPRKSAMSALIPPPSSLRLHFPSSHPGNFCV